MATWRSQPWSRISGVEGESHQDLVRVFETRTADQWEEWAMDHDLPLVAVRKWAVESEAK
jgi:hypothetical protein